MYIEERKEGESGRDYAYRIIKQNIIYRELKPGVMLSEKEIGDQLGLSRTPVREALIELAKTQIVEILPKRGSRVSYINYDLMEEAEFVRKSLELAIVKLACDMRTDEDLLELKKNLMLQEIYLEHRDHIKFMELDNAYHKKLFQICNKNQAFDMMTGLCVHLDRVRDLAITTVKDLKIVDDHIKIVDAIRDRDKETAAKVMSYHLDRYKIDKEAVRNAHPELFKDN